jgi:hypothetical protein
LDFLSSDDDDEDFSNDVKMMSLPPTSTMQQLEPFDFR